MKLKKCIGRKSLHYICFSSVVCKGCPGKESTYQNSITIPEKCSFRVWNGLRHASKSAWYYQNWKRNFKKVWVKFKNKIILPKQNEMDSLFLHLSAPSDELSSFNGLMRAKRSFMCWLFKETWGAKQPSYRYDLQFIENLI